MLSSIYSWFFPNSKDLQSKSNPELTRLLDDESNQGLTGLNSLIKDVSVNLYNKVQSTATSTIQQLSEIDYSYYAYQGYNAVYTTTSYLLNAVNKLSHQIQPPTKYDTFNENILPLKSCCKDISCKNNNNSDDQFVVVCGICFDRVKDRVLFPCGHTFCQVCTVGFNNCPVCRSQINGTMKIYL